MALPLDLRQQVPLALEEKRVLEDLLVAASDLRFMEVIHVQLPDERREVVVLEVLGQNLLAEQVDLLDDEAVLLFDPPHDVAG